MINKIFLMGHITHELKKQFIKVKRKKDGMEKEIEVAFVSFQIAVNSHTDKDKNQPLFVNCEVWEQQAENLFKYMTKGDRVHIEGLLAIETDKEDEKKKYTKIKVHKITFITTKKENENTNLNSSNNSNLDQEINKKRQFLKQLNNDIVFRQGEKEQLENNIVKLFNKEQKLKKLADEIYIP